MIKKAKVTGSKLTDFISFGAVREEFTIIDKKVTMETLPAAILRKIYEMADGLDLYTKEKVFKIEILARSIKSMGGESLVEELDSDDASHSRVEIIDKMKMVIGRWEQPVVDIFFEKYEELVTIQKAFIAEVRKKSERKTK